MKFKFNGVVYDLKHEAYPYYALIKDFIGNKINPLYNWVELYETFGRQQKHLDFYLTHADEFHKKLDDMINKILEIMKIEDAGKRLISVIKILKKASDFDWKDMEKFKRFQSLYMGILSELKGMKY
ncbi:hypothetical protein J4446_02595 [Candidatus Woesearchaeota archaeon]|nr:hypothetical protein [Candidatus Woesearchaeota archaeon]